MSNVIAQINTQNNLNTINYDKNPIYAVGQSFKGDGQAITSVSFYMKRNTTANGQVNAQIRSHFGSWGTGLPDLTFATSNPITFNNLPTTAQWVTFTFATPYQTVAGQNYFVVTNLDNFTATAGALVIYYTTYAPVLFGGNMATWTGMWTNRPTSEGLLFQVLSSGGGGGLTVSYNPNWPSGSAGSGSVPASGTYATGATVPVAANPGNLTKSGYTFLGWSTNNTAALPIHTVSGSTVTPPNFTMGTASVTLYAIWSSNSIKFSVTYEPNWPANANTSGSVPTNNNTYSTGASVPVAVNSGNLATPAGSGKPTYTFKGWAFFYAATTPDFVVSGLTVTPSSFVMWKANVVLYAVWELVGGGSGNGNFNGGEITGSLSIMRNWPVFEGLDGMRTWMYTPDSDMPNPTHPYANLYRWQNNPAGLRFVDNGATSWWTDIFGAVIRGDANSSGTPVFAVNDHLFVRRDFYARGKLCSYEGNIVLRGNKAGAVRGDSGWNVGWGPRVGTPFIWLAEGGYAGNPDAETLLIVTNGNSNIPPLTDMTDKGYQWGHVEAGKFTSHDIVHTNAIGPLIPRQYLNDPVALQTYLNTTKIESYTSIFPHPNGKTVKNLGDPTQQWDNLYVKNLHVSGSGSGGGSSVQAGTGLTDVVTGIANIVFATPFAAVPVVAVTIYDQFDTTRPIIAKLTNVTTTGFSVFTMQTLTRQHKHKTGRINSSATYSGSVQYYRNLEVINSGGSQAAVGGVIAASGQSAYDTYTDNYTPSPGEPSMVPQSANFHWIATAKTQ